MPFKLFVGFNFHVFDQGPHQSIQIAVFRLSRKQIVWVEKTGKKNENENWHEPPPRLKFAAARPA